MTLYCCHERTQKLRWTTSLECQALASIWAVRRNVCLDLGWGNYLHFYHRYLPASSRYIGPKYFIWGWWYFLYFSSIVYLHLYLFLYLEDDNLITSFSVSFLTVTDDLLWQTDNQPEAGGKEESLEESARVDQVTSSRTRQNTTKWSVT